VAVYAGVPVTRYDARFQRSPMPPQTTVSDVLDALRPIIDPDFNKSIVDLGFVKNLRIEGPSVSFAIELTTPACPVKDQFEKAAHERVLALPGIEAVT